MEALFEATVELVEDAVVKVVDKRGDQDEGGVERERDGNLHPASRIIEAHYLRHDVQQRKSFRHGQSYLHQQRRGFEKIE